MAESQENKIKKDAEEKAKLKEDPKPAEPEDKKPEPPAEPDPKPDQKKEPEEDPAKEQPEAKKPEEEPKGTDDDKDPKAEDDKPKEDPKQEDPKDEQDKDEDKEELKVDKAKKGNTCSLKDSLVFATDNYEDKICTLSKTNKNLVNENYKKMFGKSIENYDKFQLDNTTICYYDEDNYYCGLSEKYTYTIGAEPHTYRTIKSPYKKTWIFEYYDE